MREFTVLCLLVLVAAAEETPPADAPEKENAAKSSPKRAWQDMQAQLDTARKSRDFNEYRRIQRDTPKSFVATWTAAGQEAGGEERYFLGKFQSMAGKSGDAMASFAACLKDKTLPKNLRAGTWIAYAQATRGALTAGDIKLKQGAEALHWAESELAQLDARQQATLHTVLGSCHDLLGNTGAAVEHSMAAARGSPAGAYNAARGIIGMLLKETVDLDRLEATRDKANKLITELSGIYEQHVESLDKTLGGLQGTPEDKWGPNHEQQLRRAEQQVRRGRSTLQRMGGLIRPLELVGTPATAWTLEHLFQGEPNLAAYKGRVVIVDFWATWCPWCIRSFPALRDIVKDYKDKPLAIVGVTATAGYVWEHRYDLDDDFKDKSTGRTPPTLRLERNATDEQAAEYRTKERDIIATFLKNHTVTWDIVMIDKSEPKAKYALACWPHAVVIDKKGRIRFLKSGALLKDRPAAVAKFRKVLDKLLAE